MRGAYAFIEFYRKQDAEVALSMDGIMMKDTQLRIKCPKEVQVHYQQHPPKKYTIPGAIPSNVENGPNKIFLGSIPRDMTDIEVREIVENIGKLSAFNLVKDINDGSSKGYAFFTYVEPEITNHAIQVLHGHIIKGGKRLLCARAGVVPAPLPPLPTPATTTTVTAATA
uniref:Splicing factor U2AF 65 kDa subunit n=1 Tax=Lygus hesperus TaxID=30085 RepID=A0A0A9X2Q7_LYGHE